MPNSDSSAVVRGSAQTVVDLFRLMVALLWRFWPQLAAIWLLGFIGNLVLNEFAALLGRWNSLAGLSVLAVVVLLKLIIIVALFETVRPALPSLEKASRAVADQRAETASEDKEPTDFITVLTLTLVPFFAFYAAWGFLGDTLRDYSRLAFSLFLAGEQKSLLEVTGGAWLTVPIVVAWAVRRFAKAMHKRSKAWIWPVLTVLCEANWAFIGIFALSQWQGDIVAWFSQLAHVIGSVLGALSPIREAAAQPVLPTPPEFASPPAGPRLISLFFYSLYPVVWLTIAALVYGYDINAAPAIAEGRFARVVSRWKALPKTVREFIARFGAGTVKRYQALAEGIGLTLKSGSVLIVTAIVLYRVLDWLSAWAWYALTQIIGPHDLPLWQIIAQVISPFIGTPSDPGEGLLVTPIKICLLAATLELGFARGRQWRGRNQAPAAD
ncbi:hypothetical protein ASG47_01765 [Devosia sp. Leaf420]|uniref:hypothetical protein n=1 Tax=Devosia sp. Leaf420 TaxID=1736374 RepID=UPI000712F95C|nr:hypothetical protein [Devosia sp. Leaf420]KQT51638.1 hypothetical protein ASG47_01765 [Devosia sp. Leaf420]